MSVLDGLSLQTGDSTAKSNRKVIVEVSPGPPRWLEMAQGLRNVLYCFQASHMDS